MQEFCPWRKVKNVQSPSIMTAFDAAGQSASALAQYETFIATPY